MWLSARIEESTGKREIPSPTSTAVDPAVVEILLREEVEGGTGVDDGVVGVENASPATRDLIDPAIVEESSPLFADKVGSAREGRAGVDREHVNPVMVGSVKRQG